MSAEPLVAPFPYFGGKRFVAPMVCERCGAVAMAVAVGRAPVVVGGGLGIVIDAGAPDHRWCEACWVRQFGGCDER